MGEFAQLLANGLVTGSILALAAVGLSLVYGTLKIVNFAHGDYLAFGADMAFLANVTWGGSMVAATLFAVAATALLGVGLTGGPQGPINLAGPARRPPTTATAAVSGGRAGPPGGAARPATPRPHMLLLVWTVADAHRPA
jgi:branched-subunit amino acid ABC-type transport system permease component